MNGDITITEEQPDGSLKKITLAEAPAALVKSATAADARDAIGSLCEITEDSTWDDFEEGKTHVWTGGAETLAIVDSEKTGITVSNIGSGDLLFGDPEVGLIVGPGEIVTFDTVDEGDGQFSFGVTSRDMIVRDATISEKGVIELATSAETSTGEADDLAVTPEGAADTYVPLTGGTVTGDIALPNATFGANNAVTGGVLDAREYQNAGRHRDLQIASAVAVGAGTTHGLATSYAVYGRVGGYTSSSADATSAIYCPIQTSINMRSGGGGSLAWNEPWVIYFLIEIGAFTNSKYRVAVGLRTDSTVDLTGLSGTYCALEFTSATSATPFVAANGNATAGTPASVSSVTNALANVWCHNRADGNIDWYVAVGNGAQMPATPLVTQSGASTATQAGAGASFVALATDASPSFGLQLFNARYFYP